MKRVYRILMVILILIMTTGIASAVRADYSTSVNIGEKKTIKIDNRERVDVGFKALHVNMTVLVKIYSTDTTFSVMPSSGDYYEYDVDDPCWDLNTFLDPVSTDSAVVKLSGEDTIYGFTIFEEGKKDDSEITIEIINQTQYIESIDSDNIGIYIGENANLKYSVSPDNAKYSITLTSEDPDIASVDQSGKVRGLKAGSTLIHIRDAYNGMVKDVEVLVKAPVISSTSGASAVLKVGDKKTLTYKTVPTGRAVTFSSSAAGIVSVDTKGVITGVKPGSAVISAKVQDGNTVKWNVTVSKPVIVSASGDTATVKIGEKKTLTYTTDPDGMPVKFSSSSAAVVSVDTKGMITGVKPGTANISATVANGNTIQWKVTVPKPVIQSSGEKTLEIKYGESSKLSYTVDIKGLKVTFQSSDKEVADVDAAGKVTAKKAGKTVVSATVESGNTVSWDITVTETPTISESTLTLKIGKTATLSVKETGRTVVWSSDNDNIASVSQEGVITAKKGGTATITARIDTEKYTCKVTVKTDPSISKKKATLYVSEKLTLKVKNTTAKVKWSSSKKSVASVSSKGVITAKKKGSAVITAKVDGKKLTCKVTVKNAFTVNEIAAYGYLIVQKYSKESFKKNAVFKKINQVSDTQVCITWKSGKKKHYTIISLEKGKPAGKYGIVVKDIKNQYLFGGAGSTFDSKTQLKHYGYKLGKTLKLSTVKKKVKTLKKKSDWKFY